MFHGVLSFTAGGGNSGGASSLTNQCSGVFSEFRRYEAFVSGTDNISRSYCEVVFGAF